MELERKYANWLDEKEVDVLLVNHSKGRYISISWFATGYLKVINKALILDHGTVEFLGECCKRLYFTIL